MSRVKIFAMRNYAPAIGILVVVILLYLFVPGVRELPWNAVRMTGVILAAGGYVLVVMARVQLGESFSVRPEAKGLVKHGLYSRIRNPMYIFLDTMIFGLIFVLEWHWFLAVLAALAVFQSIQARREAQILQEKFGQAYFDYRKQTWF